MTWRESEVSDIRTYYRDEFPDYIEQLPEFITPDGPKQWAVALTHRYPVIDQDNPKNFIRRSTRPSENANTARETYFRDWDDVIDFIRDPVAHDYLREQDVDAGLADPELVDNDKPLPEAVYFGVDTHTHRWPVYIDIDAKDIARERAKNRLSESYNARNDQSYLDKAGIIDAPPEGYKYAFEDIQTALDYGFEVKDIAHSELNADDVLVVYSGQGVHVYILDQDRKHRYDAESRKVITVALEEYHDIPIDPVTIDDKARVARLPYSLHCGVSRIVQPVSSPAFDFRNDAQPAFLSDAPEPPEL